MDNNEILAKVWDNKHPQIVVVNGIAWKHYPDGDWFVSHIFELMLV